MSPRMETLLTHYPALSPCMEDIQTVFERLRDMYAAGGKLLICGNGGSAADADHISGELLKGFQSKRPLSETDQTRIGADLAPHLEQSLPAIPLTAFNALATAYTNDVNGDYIFAQLVLGLGQPGDALLAISTSGNARNVSHALRVARSKDLVTIGLSGETGGAMREHCDLMIRVPSRETFRIQELHLPIYHALCLMLEDHFFVSHADR